MVAEEGLVRHLALLQVAAEAIVPVVDVLVEVGAVGVRALAALPLDAPIYGPPK